MRGKQRVTVSFTGGAISFDAEMWRSDESLINEVKRDLGDLTSLIDSDTFKITRTLKEN
jgi:hypothetical protein